MPLRTPQPGVQIWRELARPFIRFRLSTRPFLSSSERDTTSNHEPLIDTDSLSKEAETATNKADTPQKDLNKAKKSKTEGKSHPSIFEVRLSLENFSLKTLSEIAADTTKLKHSITVPMPYSSNSAFVAEQKRLENVSVDMKAYTHSPIAPGDLVQHQSLDLTGDLALVISTPVYADDLEYRVVTRKGIVTCVPRSQISFRIPQVFSSKFLSSCLVAGIKEVQDDTFLASDKADPSVILTTKARELVAQTLSSYSDAAWAALPSTLHVLAQVHHAFNKFGVSMVLLSALHQIVIRSAHQSVENAVLGVLGGSAERSFPLGWLLPDSGYLEPQIGSFFAVHLALRHQKNLWVYGPEDVINTIGLPLTVYVRRFVLPLVKLTEESWSLHLDKIVKYMDARISGKQREKPAYYDEAIELLCAFSEGNASDSDHQSFALEILGRVQFLNKEHVLDRTCAAMLLRKLREARFIDPSPGSERMGDYERVSDPVVQLEKQFYRHYTGLERDLGADRTSHNHTVYCIDGETALEIDDGVGIERISDDQWKFYIHIADPASFFLPTDALGKVAYKHILTVYYVNKAVPMLPDWIVSAAGLGEQKETRCMTYSGIYDVRQKRVLADFWTVSPGTVSKFRKMTYNEVDSVLSSKSGPEYKDLKDLLEVSRALRNGRVASGALLFEGPQIGVRFENLELVKYVQKETDSQVLVSELMIQANRTAGEFFQKNSIPGLFRGLAPMVGYNESKYMERKPEKGRALIFEEFERLKQEKNASLSTFASLIGLWNGSSYSPSSKRHEFLGVDSYNPSTSPLRRYGDLVSHWQTHAFLRGEKLPFSEPMLEQMIPYVQSRVQAIKYAQRGSETFWKLVYILGMLTGRLYKAVLINLEGQLGREQIYAEANKFYFLCTKGDEDGGPVRGFLDGYNVSATLRGEAKCGDAFFVRVAKVRAVDLEIEVIKY